MTAADPRKPQHEFHKLAKRLRRQVGQAIADFNMIEDGDRVMVCLSGGKDSYGMLDILMKLQAKAPVRFELVSVHLDLKQPGYEPDVLPRHLRAVGVPFQILEQDTYSVVKRVVPEGKTMCGLCSRLRRGALYTHAKREGFTKIALGHHRDDIVETMFLNLFHHAKLSAMPPKLQSEDGAHIVAGLLCRRRPRGLRGGERLPDHAVQPVRLAGNPAAQGDQGDARRVGAQASRPHRPDLPRHRRRAPLAAGRPHAVRLRRARRA